MAERKIELTDGVPSLNTYYVYMTAGCNLACRHCWIAPAYQANGGTGGHLNYDLFELAIEEGLPLGLRNVKLTGGEPLLHPEFIRMVDLLKEKKLDLAVETNGTLLTPALAHYLKDKSTLQHISISLDGASPETHDAFRGVRGSFEKACNGIRYLANEGYRPQVIMSLHAGNIDEIESLVELAGQLGAYSVKFNIIQPSGRGEVMNDRGQTLKISRLIELGKWIDGELNSRSKVRLIYGWPMAFYGVRSLLTLGAGSCDIFNVLGILSAGHLAMCGIGMQVPELSYGRLGEDKVADVWKFNPMLLNLRANIPAKLEGICGNCILRDQCLGSCIAQNYHLNNRLTSSHWFCEEAYLAGLFPQSRRKDQPIE